MDKKIFTATAVTDVLDYAAAVLGWRPRHSLVLLLMQENTLGPVLRMDASNAPARVIAQAMLANSSEAVADGALVMGFDAEQATTEALAAELEQRGLPVHQIVTVIGDRYAITDGEAGEWTPGESVIGLWAAMQHTERDGVPVLPVPAGLDATDALAEKARLLAGDHEAGIREARALWAARLDGQALTEGQETTVRAALTLAEPRDRMLADMYGAGDEQEDMESVFRGDLVRVDWPRTEAGQDALRDLITRSTASEAAHMLALLAHTYWLQGRGTPSGETAEAAHRADEHNRFAWLMIRLTSSPMVPPVAKDPARAWSANKGR